MWSEAEWWNKVTENSKWKRNKNMVTTKTILDKEGIEYIEKPNGHYIIEPYNFWSSTWLFIHKKTNKRWRGIFNLIKKLKE